MTVLLAVAISVPAFGGPDNPVADTFASAKKTAKKALKKAKQANKKAKQAQTAADNAQSTANGAQTTANQAKNTANGAQTAADNAQASADNAQATADAAQTAAGNAQAAANAAQASANTKFDTTDFVAGPTSANDSSNFKLIAAGCPTGFEVTGGGHVIGGTGAGNVAATISQQYLNGWLVRADEVNAIASNWTVGATVNCID